MWHSSLGVYFSRYLLPSFFALLASFFSPAGHFVDFILVGKGFTNAFRILGLDARKGRWVVEQNFRGNFQVNVRWFLVVFSGVLDWIVLILVWFERSFQSAQVSRQKKLIMSQSVERAWIRMSAYGQLRVEWVDQKLNLVLHSLSFSYFTTSLNIV